MLSTGQPSTTRPFLQPNAPSQLASQDGRFNIPVQIVLQHLRSSLENKDRSACATCKNKLTDTTIANALWGLMFLCLKSNPKTHVCYEKANIVAAKLFSLLQGCLVNHRKERITNSTAAWANIYTVCAGDKIHVHLRYNPSGSTSTTS